MKGVILAGGTGSRLRPLTEITNKHLLPVGNWPMIYYPLGKLIQAGITDILIVTGTEHMGSVVTLLGSGRRFGCQLTYRVQDEAGGIAQAIGLAEGFAAGGPIAVVLGDNIFEQSLAPTAQLFGEQDRGARVLVKEVPDPERFGVAEVDGDRILGVEEKPKHPKSNLAVVGVYFYDSHVFEIARDLKPSARGELEVTDINNAYIRMGEMRFDVMRGFWSDAGTFPSLRRSTHFVVETGVTPMDEATLLGLGIEH